MNNEDRFIASCEAVGEADVRAKVNAGRYSERKASWATSWLDQMEAGKSENTKAAESSTRLQDLHRTQNRSVFTKLALFVALVLVAVIGFAWLI